MVYTKLSPEDIAAIAKETAKQMVYMFDEEEIIKQKQRRRILKRKFVSPYVIEKYGLLHKVKTRQSVVLMIKRGEFGPENDKWFFDVYGRYQILTSAIKDMNNE